MNNLNIWNNIKICVWSDREVKVNMLHQQPLLGEVQHRHLLMQEHQLHLLALHLVPLLVLVPPFRKSPPAKLYMNLKLKTPMNSALKKETLSSEWFCQDRVKPHFSKSWIDSLNFIVLFPQNFVLQLVFLNYLLRVSGGAMWWSEEDSHSSTLIGACIKKNLFTLINFFLSFFQIEEEIGWKLVRRWTVGKSWDVSCWLCRGCCTTSLRRWGPSTSRVSPEFPAVITKPSIYCFWLKFC